MSMAAGRGKHTSLMWWCLMKLVMQLQTLCIISFHLHKHLQLCLELGWPTRQLSSKSLLVSYPVASKLLSQLLFWGLVGGDKIWMVLLYFLLPASCIWVLHNELWEATCFKLRVQLACNQSHLLFSFDLIYRWCMQYYVKYVTCVGFE